jgi:hypothetical protein
LVWPPELGELEPHAAIAVAAAIAAALRHAQRGRRITRVLSSIMPSSGLDDHAGPGQDRAGS